MMLFESVTQTYDSSLATLTSALTSAKANTCLIDALSDVRYSNAGTITQLVAFFRRDPRSDVDAGDNR